MSLTLDSGGINICLVLKEVLVIFSYPLGSHGKRYLTKLKTALLLPLPSALLAFI